MKAFAELPVSRWLFLVVMAILPVLPMRAEDVTTVEEITDNLRITTSVKFKKGRYVVRDADGNGVLHVAADGITIDLDGVELWGSAGAAADTFSGVGLVVHGRRNVKIVNASVHGYKYNIRVEDSSGVSIRRCDVSHSLAPRISRDGEKMRIWLGLRSLDAWRSYGAGIWIENSRQCVVEACRGQNAANGLLTVETTESSFRSNDFSFVSGWGIGLYRSSRNEVFWNHLDFVGRPWGGSVGADAAALVLVHSCNGAISELEAAGYIHRIREGRKNRYEVNPGLPLPVPVIRELALGDLLNILEV